MGANSKSACHLAIIFLLLTPLISFADILHSVNYRLVDNYSNIFAWDTADTSVENNSALGYLVIDYRVTNDSRFQPSVVDLAAVDLAVVDLAVVSTTAKHFQPIINDRKMHKQLRALMSEYTDTHPSINWLPASKVGGSIEPSNHHAILDKSAIRSALRKSIIQWWQNRKALSVKRKGATSSAVSKVTQAASRPYKKNWGYRFNVSSKKVKFTLKREL